MIRPLKIFWAFTRPHTIVGSVLSITSLYLVSIAVVFPLYPQKYITEHSSLWAITIISALACNVYITGLNQLMDIEIDRINKPWLPIPSGDLPKGSAKIIILVAGILSLVSAALGSYFLLNLIAAILLIGTAYSLPPLKFKRHHVGAAASILMVRGLLVNIGMPVHFIYVLTRDLVVPADVWPITWFVTFFSLAIAWFKDIPDTTGDAVFEIKTLAIRITPVFAFRYGVFVVAMAYIGTMWLAAWLHILSHSAFFFTSHAFLLLLFLAGASKVSLQDPAKVKRFYLIFWGFFFAEYIVYAIPYYIQ